MTVRNVAVHGPADWGGSESRTWASRVVSFHSASTRRCTSSGCDDRQYAGFAPRGDQSPLRHLLAAGQSGLSTAFDLPPRWATIRTTPCGGEIGRSEWPSPVEDLHDLFRESAGPGLDLDDDPTHCGDPARDVRGGGEEQGVPRRSCRARYRTTFSRSTSPGEPTSTPLGHRCAWSRTCSGSWPKRDELQPHLDQRLSHA